MGPVTEERPTQRGDDRHQNNKHTMVERAEPHTGHKAFSAMEHKEERSKPQQHSPSTVAYLRSSKETAPARQTLGPLCVQPDTQGETTAGDLLYH